MVGFTTGEVWCACVNKESKPEASLSGGVVNLTLMYIEGRKEGRNVQVRGVRVPPPTPDRSVGRLVGRLVGVV